MKYTTEIEINAPIAKIAALLGDHEQMNKWMKELERYEPVSGHPRHEGAKTRMLLNVGRGMEVTETIVKAEPPHRFTARYEMEGGSLLADSMLQETTPNLTRYSLSHYFKFEGMLKIATALMKPAFIKHSEQMMKDFKMLAEQS